MIALYTADGELVDHLDMTVFQLVSFMYNERSDEEKLRHDVPPYRIVNEKGQDVDWQFYHEDFETEEYKKAKRMARLNAMMDEKMSNIGKSKVTLNENVSCQSCKSNRVADVGGKCSDMSNVSLGDKEHDGYLPDIGVGSGDYFEFSFCLDCGMIQGEWPLPLTELEIGDEDEDDDPEY